MIMFPGFLGDGTKELADNYDHITQGSFATELERKKERNNFIYPLHAINIRRYYSSVYIIHTVE
jgi:hypothetical protein